MTKYKIITKINKRGSGHLTSWDLPCWGGRWGGSRHWKPQTLSWRRRRGVGWRDNSSWKTARRSRGDERAAKSHNDLKKKKNDATKSKVRFSLETIWATLHWQTQAYLLTESCWDACINVLLLFVQVGQGILGRNGRWASDHITSCSSKAAYIKVQWWKPQHRWGSKDAVTRCRGG